MKKLILLLFSTAFFISQAQGLHVNPPCPIITEALLVGRFRCSEASKHYNNIRIAMCLNGDMYLHIHYNDDDGPDTLIKNKDFTNEFKYYNYIRIKVQDWEVFEKATATIKEKFERWSQIAQTNNDRNFSKTIPVNYKCNIYDPYPLGERDSIKELSADFVVDSNGHCYLRFCSHFFFNSPKAFNELCEAINKKNAMHKYNEYISILQKKEEKERQRDALYD